MKRGHTEMYARAVPAARHTASARWTQPDIDAFFDGFQAHGRNYELIQRDFLPHKDAAKIKYIFGKVVKQINHVVAPLSVSRIRNQQVLQGIFSAYRAMVLRQQAQPSDEERDRHAADLLATMSEAAGAAAMPDLYAEHASAAGNEAFKAVVEQLLTGGASAAKAAGTETSQSSQSSSSSSLVSSALETPAQQQQQQKMVLANPQQHTAAATSTTPATTAAAAAAVGQNSAVVPYPVPSPSAEQKISLSLTARDENSAAVVAKCGFVPVLVLTFKMSKRSLGSIIVHIATKWFTHIHLRNLPARPPPQQQQQQQQQPQQQPQQQANKALKKKRKPAAVQYLANRITLVLHHCENGAVIGSWDRTNKTLFSEYVPNLPTSISAPVLSSPTFALPVFYTIAGVTPDDVIVQQPPATTAAAAAAATTTTTTAPTAPTAPAASEAPGTPPRRPVDDSDSVALFHSFGRLQPPNATPLSSKKTPPRQAQQPGFGTPQSARARRSTPASAGAAAAAAAAPGLGEDTNGSVLLHLEDKSFTSFVRDNAEMPPVTPARAMAAAMLPLPSPIKGFSPYSPFGANKLFPQGTPGGPGASPSSANPLLGGGYMSPERPSFLSAMLGAMIESGASRDGLPKEDSQMALFPERSTGYSNQGLPFMSPAHSLHPFPGSTLTGAGDSNF